MVTVKFFTTLRLMLKIQEIQIELVEPSTIQTVLGLVEEAVWEKISLRFLDKLLDDQKGIRKGTMILVNGRNILDGTGLKTPVKDEDIIALFPPGGGG